MTRTFTVVACAGSWPSASTPASQKGTRPRLILGTIASPQS
ncbi:hypothetical protein QEP77_07005 [Serratia sp. B1]|nr:hypothetical protein QEP77_07005 [Serratia sp. B1]